jgi:hypothetical protein
MWGTEVVRGDGPVPFLVYEQRRRRVTELLDDARTGHGQPSRSSRAARTTQR